MAEPRSASVARSIDELLRLLSPKDEREQGLVFKIAKELEEHRDQTTPMLIERFLKAGQAPEVRLFIGDLLSYVRGEGAARAFEQVLNSQAEEEWIRARSAYYLGLVGDEDALRVLSRVVSDTAKPEPVRVDAIAGIAAYYREHTFDPEAHKPVLEALSAVVARLEGNGYLLNNEAVRTLGYLRCEEAGSLILKVVKQAKEPELRRQAIFALAESGCSDKRAFDKLMHIYDQDNEDFKGPIIEALGKLKIEGTVRFLKRVLSRNFDDYHATLAARALVEIGDADPSVVEALSDALQRAQDPFAKRSIDDARQKLAKLSA
jgi:HEAT repeat protein